MVTTVLITGGAGFIGQNLMRTLFKKDYHVINYDLFLQTTEEKLFEIEGSQGRLKNVRGNILDSDLMSQTLSQNHVDYVILLAAQKYVDFSIKHPVKSSEINVLGLINACDCAAKAGVKRVIFASSAAVYGTIENLPHLETMVPEPASPYALDKVVGEQYLKMFAKLYPDLDTTSLRFFDVYGPGQVSLAPHCGGVTIVMNQLEKEGRSVLLGDGSMTRDYVYIGDVCDGIVNTIESENRINGEVMNICSGTQIEVKAVHTKIAETMGLVLKTESKEFLPGNVVHSKGCFDKANTLIGYTPKVDLDEGIKLTFEWMKKNNPY